MYQQQEYQPNNHQQQAPQPPHPPPQQQQTQQNAQSNFYQVDDELTFAYAPSNTTAEAEGYSAMLGAKMDNISEREA